MTSCLQHLMAAHDAALTTFDAQNDGEYDKDNDLVGKAVDNLRDAILNHRPTLDEVPVKAAFMASRKTFSVWDNFDHAKLITALTPVEGEGDGASRIVRTAPPDAVCLAQSVRASEVVAGRQKADGRPTPCARASQHGASPAGRILIASIVGMAICATWIAITWRAWG